MEVQILTLNINHEKEFMLKYPSFELNKDYINILFLLTKYELLLTEQYFINHLQPNLNIQYSINHKNSIY
jgi:hypothetical protein